MNLQTGISLLSDPFDSKKVEAITVVYRKSYWPNGWYGWVEFKSERTEGKYTTTSHDTLEGCLLEIKTAITESTK